MGDDDGFLAVVMANRLPQFDRANCLAVRYMACLINLEGQLEVLPPAVPPLPQFDAMVHVQDLRRLGKAKVDTDRFAMGQVDIDASALLTLTPDRGGRPTDVRTVQQPAEQRSAKGDSWRSTQTTIGEVAVSATAHEAARVVREEMKAGFRFPVEGLVLERVYRFPVLASLVVHVHRCGLVRDAHAGAGCRPARDVAGGSGRAAAARLRPRGSRHGPAARAVNAAGT